MTLVEIISRIHEWYDPERNVFEFDFTVYASSRDQHFSPSSEAIVAQPKKSGKAPKEAVQKGLEYFLEVSLIVEVLEVWSEWRNGQVPTLEEKCKAAIFYAENDCYIEDGE
jgi:hypothetical protein